MKKLLCILAAVGILAGCSTSDSKERELELMASNRASVLSEGLPIEQGPLKILRIDAKGGVVRMMMIYNAGAQGAKPVNTVLDNSIASYCKNNEIKTQLNMGLVYRITIRDPRGQVIADKMVNKSSCDQ